jgi:hypothetical protein
MVGGSRSITTALGDGAGGVDDTHPLGTGIDSVVGTDVIITDIEADGDPDIVFAGGTLGVVENAVEGRPHH